MAAFTSITVAAGKTIQYKKGHTLITAVATEVIIVPTPDATRFVAAGLAALT